MGRIRLNLGSGPVAAPGWENLDRSPTMQLDRVPFVKPVLRRAGLIDDVHMTSWSRDIRSHDLRKPLPHADESVEAIYSSHTLEHLYRDDARRVLAECHRVLVPGGILRLALPNVEDFARKLLDDPSEEAALTFNRELAQGGDAPPSFRRRMLMPFQGSTHRWQPTPALVTAMLTAAGFAQVARHGFHEGALPGLAEIETRPESFFLEATK